MSCSPFVREKRIIFGFISKTGERSRYPFHRYLFAGGLRRLFVGRLCCAPWPAYLLPNLYLVWSFYHLFYLDINSDSVSDVKVEMAYFICKEHEFLSLQTLSLLLQLGDLCPLFYWTVCSSYDGRGVRTMASIYEIYETPEIFSLISILIPSFMFLFTYFYNPLDV